MSQGYAGLPRNRAYDNLKKEESGLVDTYERLLSHELEGDPSSTDLKSQKNEIEQKNPDMRRDQMSRLVAAELKKIERETKIEENIGAGMQPVSYAKGVIDNTVVNAYPEASLAWAGVCCALQMLANLITETRANREGIAYVNRDDGESAGLRDELEKHVIDLYKPLLSYQMKSVYSYYRSRRVVFWRDVINLDDWDGSLKTIKSAEDTIRQDAFAYNIESIKGHFEKLVKAAKFQHKLLPDIHQAIRDQTAEWREMRQEEKNEKQEEKIKECLADLRRNSDEARLLWIKGDPGKRKTMLLITIVDELEKQLAQQGPSAALSYFFCQGTNKDLNNATAVLRGLVYLLGDKYLSLVSHLRKRYDNARSKLFEDMNAIFTLSEVLEDMLRDASLLRAYIVIDALDECGTDLPRLLKFIVRNSSASPRVKWIVSSRNRPGIEQQLKLDNSGIKLSLGLTQNAEQVARSVNAYIDFKISKLPSLDGNDKANGAFLWAALVAQKLENIKSWHVLKVVEEMPTDLEELYARMIEYIQQLERGSEFGLLVLATVTLAYRPLRLAELDNYVYLIHQSVKDYLSDKASSIIFPPGPTAVHSAIFSLSSRPEIETVSHFLREKFLYWLEALGLIQHMGDAILSITRSESLLREQSTNRELLDLVKDSRRFILQNRWIVENAPLQI
ncbi:NACHT domain-containing protein [Xylaria sp. FL1042]|nr:NACHT domain-containing protein [Xylaria sp. FL1042]